MQIADNNNGDTTSGLAVDPVHHVVYTYVGGAAGKQTNEIEAIPYDPANGTITAPGYDAATDTQQSTTRTIISTQSDGAFASANDLAYDRPPRGGPGGMLVHGRPGRHHEQGWRSWSRLRSQPCVETGLMDLGCRRLVANRAVRSHGVVVLPPALYDDLRLT